MVATVSKSYILLILLFQPLIIIAKCIKFFYVSVRWRLFSIWIVENFYRQVSYDKSSLNLNGPDYFDCNPTPKKNRCAARSEMSIWNIVAQQKFFLATCKFYIAYFQNMTPVSRLKATVRWLPCYSCPLRLSTPTRQTYTESYNFGI